MDGTESHSFKAGTSSSDRLLQDTEDGGGVSQLVIDSNQQDWRGQLVNAWIISRSAEVCSLPLKEAAAGLRAYDSRL